MKLKKRNTNRGFGIIEFTDSYEQECSIQMSSNVIPHLWIGVDNTGPRTGNEDISSRIHIKQKDIPKLIKILQKYVDTGEI